MGIYRNFDIFHSLLDLSLVFLSEHGTISEILIKASKFTTPRAYLSMVENTHALRSIRMEGMRFCKQNKEFCMQIRMDGKLSQTELSSLKIYYLSLTLRVAFPLFLVLGSNAKLRHFQI